MQFSPYFNGFGQEEVLQGADQGAKQGMDKMGPGKQASGVVEQGQGDQEQAEEVVLGPRMRRSSKVRKEKRDKDFHYYYWKWGTREMCNFNRYFRCLVSNKDSAAL